MFFTWIDARSSEPSKHINTYLVPFVDDLLKLYHLERYFQVLSVTCLLLEKYVDFLASMLTKDAPNVSSTS